MAKRKNNELAMVDMSNRLKIQIIKATDEESAIIDKKIEDANISIELSIEERIHSYENRMDEYILKSWENISDDSKYAQINSASFLEKYDDMINSRNKENVKRRIQQYQSYLSMYLKDASE